MKLPLCTSLTAFHTGRNKMNYTIMLPQNTQACWKHSQTRSFSDTNFKIYLQYKDNVYIFNGKSALSRTIIGHFIWVLSFLCNTFIAFIYFYAMKRQLGFPILYHSNISISISDTINTNYFYDIIPLIHFHKTHSVLGGRCCVLIISHVFILHVHNITVSLVSAYSSTYTALLYIWLIINQYRTDILRE